MNEFEKWYQEKVQAIHVLTPERVDNILCEHYTEKQ